MLDNVHGDKKSYRKIGIILCRNDFTKKLNFHENDLPKS